MIFVTEHLLEAFPKSSKLYPLFPFGDLLGYVLGIFWFQMHDLCKNKDYIHSIYTEGAKRAGYLASKTLRKVHRKLGYVDR